MQDDEYNIQYYIQYNMYTVRYVVQYDPTPKKPKPQKNEFRILIFLSKQGWHLNYFIRKLQISSLWLIECYILTQNFILVVDRNLSI